jgi:hypothetical protein
VSVAFAAARYLQYFRDNHLLDLPIPIVPGNKRPLVAHKVEKGVTPWTPEAAKRFFEDQNRANCYLLGIRMVTLIAIDVDCHELAADLMRRFPALASAPRQRTRKGAHFLFRRTPECDELRITDGARKLRENGADLPLDIKTVCRTKTGGVLVVWPSPEKSWEVPLLGLEPPPDLPSELAAWIWQRTKGNKRDAEDAEAARPPTPKARRLPGKRVRVLEDGAPRVAATPECDLPDLERLGFKNLRFTDLSIKEEEDGYLFRYSGAPCPLCADVKGHTNRFRVKYDLAAGTRAVKSYSRGCLYQGAALPDSPEGVAAWRRWFERQLLALPAKSVASLAEVLGSLPSLPRALLGWRTDSRWYLRGERPDEYVELRLEGVIFVARVTGAPWLKESRLHEREVALPAHLADDLVEALLLEHAEAA